MLVRCTEDQDLVGEKDERGKALSANVERSAGVGGSVRHMPTDGLSLWVPIKHRQCLETG